MRTAIALLCGTVVWAAGAAGQEVKPVVCSPDDALEAASIYADAGQFGKPADANQTVSKLAVVASFMNSTVKAAIDSSKPDVKAPDVLRLDFSGTGKFDTDSVVPLSNVSTQGTSMAATIGPKTLQVKQGDRTIPVTVRGSYYKSDTYRRMTLTLSTAVEASCKFGEKTCKVRLIDGTNNLKMADAARPIVSGGRPNYYQAGDTIAVDTGDGTFTKGVRKSFYGQPVIVGGKAYTVSLSADGTKVSVEPSTAALGKIQVDQPVWEAKLVSAKHVTFVSGGKEPVEVPEGNYAIVGYQVRPEAKSPAMLGGRGPTDKQGRPVLLAVAAGGVTALAIGAPLKAVVEPTQTDDMVRLSLALTDAAGGRISSLANNDGTLPPPPKVKVVDDQGKTVYEKTLEYG